MNDRPELADLIDAFEADYNGFHLGPAHMADWFKKLRAALAKAPGAQFDIEAMLTACVPGGHSCDPQRVADAIRAYCATPPAVSEASDTAAQADFREGVNLERLRAALSHLGLANGDGMEHAAADMANLINRLTRSVMTGPYFLPTAPAVGAPVAWITASAMQRLKAKLGGNGYLSTPMMGKPTDDKDTPLYDAPPAASVREQEPLSKAQETEVVRLARVAIRECPWPSDEHPNDWSEAALKVCHIVIDAQRLGREQEDTGRADGKHWLDGFGGVKSSKERNPLTDEQIYSICAVQERDVMMKRMAVNCARAVEKAHGVDAQRLGREQD